MPFWFIRPITWTLIRLLYWFTGGIRFEGRENVPQTGGVLITPNHISDSDPPTVAFALPRACWIMAKEELFDIRILGRLIVWLHGFPVKRYTADRAALRKAEDLLKQGEAVIIFPEGKLSQDGALQPMLPGALLVANRANVPIVPTVLIDTNLLVPYGQSVPRRIGRPVIVRFGPPVTVAELTGGVRGGEGLKEGAERLAELMRALQQGQPYPPIAPREASSPDAPPVPSASA